jgi:DNA-binding transcriptional MerR regulator
VVVKGMLENHELEVLRRKPYLSIGEVAEVIDSTAHQIRKWERSGLMPPPQSRVTRGSRPDRRYTWAEVERMKELRAKYRVGAPTAEDALTRQRIREEILAGE